MNNEQMLEKNMCQVPAVELFIKLGYVYISNDECRVQRKGNYNCILEGILKEQLKKINFYEYDGKLNKFSNYNIDKAVSDLDIPTGEGLIKASEKIYNKLIMGCSYEENVGDRKISFDLNYIDWKQPENNVFHITKEFSVDSLNGENNTRVDIVLFVNGIPFCAIECKSGIVSIDQAIDQTIRNQTDSFIPQLYKFVSLVIACNKNEVKYGTTGTCKKFFSVWNYERDEKNLIEEKIKILGINRLPTYQDKIFVAMISPNRLLDITRYFVLFKGNEKIVCRSQQFYCVHCAIDTIMQYNVDGNRKSGIVWHTQGSGKSLTMVILANYILTNINPGQSKVVIVTDRKNLDKQITKTFSDTKIRPTRATTGKNLIDIIQKGKADVITTIINKFDTVDKFNVKIKGKDIFILIDESHRSNYGELSLKMRRVFPNASYIGFTGTPLMKNEKTVMKFGGNYIHEYTIKDGVDDKIIVPLLYEGRFIDQAVDENNIDLWFDKTCKKLNEKQKRNLTQKWCTISKLNSTNARIDRIMLDIEEHFDTNIKATGFKAMLATNSKLDAVRYYNAFNQYTDLKVSVCISKPDSREGYDDVNESNVPEVLKFWKEMMQKYNNDDNYEESIKNDFCDGEIDILIVCSMLLTGFDVPICQVLYNDKQLKEHNLLQAIARTNRLYNGKDFGLIIDYRGLFPQLKDALNTYSGDNGLDNFNQKDLNSLITDIISVVAELRQAYTNIENNFISVKNKDDEEEYEIVLEQDEKLRQKFYTDWCVFGKKLRLVLSSYNAYSVIYDNDPKEMIMYKDKFVFYSKLRVIIKKRCAEIIDNEDHQSEMRNLLDKHMSVVGLEILTKQLDIMKNGEIENEIRDLKSDGSKADAIRNNLSRNISIKYSTNPAFYDSFSKNIKEVLAKYKEKIISESDYLKEMTKMLDDIRSNRSRISYPKKIERDIDAQAFYGAILPIINEREEHPIDIIGEVALYIKAIIFKQTKVDWRNNPEIHKKIDQEIEDLFWELGKSGPIKLGLVDVDKILTSVMNVALGRF